MTGFVVDGMTVLGDLRSFASWPASVLARLLRPKKRRAGTPAVLMSAAPLPSANRLSASEPLVRAPAFGQEGAPRIAAAAEPRRIEDTAMTNERTRAFRRVETALHPRRPKVPLAWIYAAPKKWKLQFRRRNKLVRAAKIGLVWPQRAWREHFEEVDG
jgi:hypothetical protein